MKFKVGDKVKAKDSTTASLPSYQGHALGNDVYRVKKVDPKDGSVMLEGFLDVWVGEKSLVMANSVKNASEGGVDMLRHFAEEIIKKTYKVEGSSIGKGANKQPFMISIKVKETAENRNKDRQVVAEIKKLPHVKDVRYSSTRELFEVYFNSAPSSTDKVVANAIAYVKGKEAK